MRLSSWLRSAHSLFAPRGTKKEDRQARLAKRRLPTRPSVEQLDDRIVLSTFTVLNLADGGEGSLRSAVLAANAHPGADAIDFAPGLSGTIGLTSGELIIRDDLTVNGPGAALLAVSGNDTSRVFSMGEGLNVDIASLTITHGQAVGASGGGGILNVGGTLNLDGVVLSYNNAVSSSSSFAEGGAIRSAHDATLTVRDSHFIGNRAIGKDQAQYGGAQGGAISNEHSIATIIRSTFEGNQAQGGSGGVVKGTNNRIGEAGGGAIFSGHGPSSLTVRDSVFTGNRVLGGDGGRVGNIGGFYSMGDGFGGAIANFGLSNLLVAGSTFSSNLAIGGSNIAGSTNGPGEVSLTVGGAIYNAGIATITDSSLAHNEAIAGSNNVGGASVFVSLAYGGGIANDASFGPGALQADNLTFVENRAVGGSGFSGGRLAGAAFGGALANGFEDHVGAKIAVSTSTFTANRVVGGGGAGGSGGDAFGGGLANSGGNALAVINSVLSGNHSVGGNGGPGGDAGNGFGGGIWNGGLPLGTSARLTIINSMITANEATGGAGGDGMSGGNAFGGGVYNGAAASLRLEGTTITENHASGGVGGADGSEGEGLGGGVYNLGDFEFDALSLIFANLASTSHDDIFDPFA